ncbi:MAG TPA: SIS domain-containing protein [Thermoleophilaceae bacterium]|jgi:glucosamine--fructose-6-phosphate aminotransferase (isomerizing)|nr:SIS domain-containing protein [Thermoleophilaceae bacterium]
MTSGGVMAAEMAEQPGILSRLIAQRDELFARVRAILPPPPVRVVIVARGSSDHAAVYGRYVLEHAARTPVALAAPSLRTRYRVDTGYNGYLAIAASQSGRTPEIVSTLEHMRSRGAVTLAVTNDADSPLAQAADLALGLGAGPERAIPATKTFTAQLAMFALLAEAIGPVPWAPSDWETVVPAVEAVLADPAVAAPVAAEIGSARAAVVLARGYFFSVALEAALKLKETTSLLAWADSTADFRHGPIAVVDSGLPVLALSAEGPCEADVAEIVRDIAARGGRVLSIADTPRADLPTAPGVPEALATIAAGVRAQQLALALARHRGLDADAPAGLSKITATA